MILFLIISYIVIVLLSYVIYKDNCRYLRNKHYKHFIGIIRILGLFALFIRFFYYHLWSASFFGDILLFISTFYMVNFTLSLCFFILRKIFHHQKRFHGSESIIIISIVSLVFCGFGVQQAVDFQIKSYTIQSNKEVDIKIALLSDLHLGNSLRKKSLSRLMDIVKTSDAQMLVITGDLFDESTAMKDMDNFIKEVQDMKIPVYYVEGNHEIQSVYHKQFYQMMETANITMLFDESILIQDDFYLIGRRDAKNSERKELHNLTDNLDKDKFMLVLDHQPMVEEGSEIDLQLSGHTHNGQIFPANLITKLRYSNLYGYYDEEYPMIVTSGAGTWGFPMRMGTQSEVVLISIE